MLRHYYKIDPLDATSGSVVTLPADSPMHTKGWYLGTMAEKTETVTVGQLFCSDGEEAKKSGRFPASWSSYEKHRKELKEEAASSSAASTTTLSNEVSLQKKYEILQEQNAKLRAKLEEAKASNTISN